MTNIVSFEVDSRLLGLKDELEKVKNDKEELIMEMAVLSRRRTTRANAEELQIELENIQKTLNNLSLAEIRLQEAIVARNSGSGFENHNAIKKQDKNHPEAHEHQSYLLPSNLPTFRTGSHNTEHDSAVFIERFSRILKAHNIPEERWINILPAYCFEACANWLENVVLNKPGSWAELKEQFIVHYQHSTSQQRNLINLLTIKMRKNESVQEYSDRFCHLMRLAKGDETDVRLVEQYWLSLPPEIRSDVASTRLHSPVNSIHDIMRYAIMHSTARYAVEQDQETIKESKEATKRNSNHPPSYTVKNFKRCDFCKRPGHEFANCRFRGVNQNPITQKSPIIKCQQCGKPGHSVSVCSMGRTKRDAASVKVAVVQEDDYSDEVTTEDHSINDYLEISKNLSVMSVTNEPKSPDAPDDFQVSIKLNGLPVSAHIDTGARQSFISPTTLQELKVNIIPKRGTIRLACSDSSIVRTGTSPNITVECGSRKVEHAFEVMKILDNIPCLIGQDLFYSLGFALSHPCCFDEVSSSQDKNQEACDSETPKLVSEENNAALNIFRNHLMQALQPVLQRNQAIPSGSFCNIPEATVALETGQHPPSYVRQYHIPHHAQAIVEEKIDKWLREGTIIPAESRSSWNSPLIVVPKKDSQGKKTDWRICLDTRAINKMLPDDRFPIPLVRDIFNKLVGSTLFTTLDLRDSYHQFPLRTSDRHKTTFSWNNKQYMFAGCPFGLKPLSSIFQRVMSQLFSNEHFVLVFIDDIIVFSANEEDHFHHIAAVVQKLTNANLSLRVSKCFFAYKSVSLLGHRVSESGISMDTQKIDQAQHWPQPKSGKDIEKFLGLVNYFRDFIPCYSTIAAPLEGLRKRRNLEQLWSSDCEEAFNSLKSLLFVAPILQYPDFSREFYVATDASQTGVGACLYQMVEGKARYILFAAKSLSQAERNYSATKRELLAMVFALKRFHYYLWGKKFTLFTDHKALTFLFSQKNSNEVINTWLDTILGYNFDIFHRPGILNCIPDALSRLFPVFVKDKNASKIEPKVLECKTVNSTCTPISPPEEERAELIEKAHLLGHFGEEAMMKHLLNENLFWPSMRRQCKEKVLACIQCQKVNTGKTGYHPLRPIHASLPWDHIAVDLAGPLPKSKEGYTYLLIMVCVCTRFVILRPLSDKSASSVAKELLEVFLLFGFPRIMQSDNGTEFINKVVKEITTSERIDARVISPYHPRANGLAERTVQTSIRAIKKLLNGDFASWSLHISAIQFAINVKVSAIHASSPFSFMFGRKFNAFKDFTKDKSRPMSPQDLIEHYKRLYEVIYPEINKAMRDRRDKEAEKFAKTHLVKNNLFPNGSLVMVKDLNRMEKLDPTFEGPFKVIRRNKGGAYQLQDMTGSLIERNFPPSMLKLVSTSIDSQDPAYQVKAILNHRGKSSKREYLVRWKGYAEEHDSWEPESNFLDNNIIRKYWKAKQATVESQFGGE